MAETREEYAIRSIPGWLTVGEGNRLRDLARECAPLGPILEIGSYCGKSTVHLGVGVEQASCGSFVIAVDQHRGSPDMQPGQPAYPTSKELLDDRGLVDTLPQLRYHLRNTGLEPITMVIVAPSIAASLFVRVACGMVFIDGDHSEVSVRNDYQAWGSLVLPGGVLAMHDCNEPQVRLVYNEIVDVGLFEPDLIAFTDKLGVLRRKSDT